MYSRKGAVLCTYGRGAVLCTYGRGVLLCTYGRGELVMKEHLRFGGVWRKRGGGGKGRGVRGWARGWGNEGMGGAKGLGG